MGIPFFFGKGQLLLGSKWGGGVSGLKIVDFPLTEHGALPLTHDPPPGVLCLCVVNVSPVQAVDLNVSDSVWNVIVPGH